MVMPQVYWVQSSNPAEQLEKSYTQYREITDLPYLPTGAAYCSDGWCPTDEQIVEFAAKAEELQLPGINFWEWAAATNDGFWNAVAGIDYDIPEVPAPDCEELLARQKAEYDALIAQMQIQHTADLEKAYREGNNKALDNLTAPYRL